MADKTYERCDLCDEKTGRAGRYDDSIYRDVIKACDDWDGYRFEVGVEIGPLCPDCFYRLEEAGIVGED